MNLSSPITLCQRADLVHSRGFNGRFVPTILTSYPQHPPPPLSFSSDLFFPCYSLSSLSLESTLSANLAKDKAEGMEIEG